MTGMAHKIASLPVHIVGRALQITSLTVKKLFWLIDSWSGCPAFLIAGLPVPIVGI
jgi:hypothetical protein